MNLYKNIGEKIKELRNRKKISQTQLANELGFKSDVAIVLIEQGKRRLSVEALKKASDYFKVPVTELFGDEASNADEKQLYSILRKDKSLTETEVEKIMDFIKFLKKDK